MPRSKTIGLLADPPALLAHLAKKLLVRRLLIPLNNGFYSRFPRTRSAPPAGLPGGLAARSDISDHLPRLYTEALVRRPRLIVELGTRGGESTRVLLAVAEACDAQVVSVDLADCTALADGPAASRRWHFVRDDDVAFAGRFPAWCAERGLTPRIDVLFVDTSHLYDHTRAELAAWLPHLADAATAIFHDTNMREFYRREDGTIAVGWDNQRGVIRALEEHLGTRYDETTRFKDVRAGWSVDHFPQCNGFTVLRRPATADR